MAHRGREYPLAFSREIPLGLRNYRNSLGHQYDATFTGTAGTIGGAMSGLRVRVKEQPRLPGNLVFWKSDPVHIGAFTVVYELLAGFTSSPQRNLYLLSAIETTLGEILAIRMSTNQGSSCESFSWDAAIDPVTFKPPWTGQGITGPIVASAVVVPY